jgi:hypothetical protein
VDAYLPLGMNSLEGSTSDFLSSPAAPALSLYARLRPGVTLAAARAALPLTANTLERQFPEVDRNLELQLYAEAHAPGPQMANGSISVAIAEDASRSGACPGREAPLSK